MKNPFLTEYVKQNLRACQLKQLSILEETDRICRKYDIPYWLDGGSLLGAVRHGGFIPWDDDIDIAMRLEDLSRFVQVASSELPDNLFLQTRESDPSDKRPVTKIRDLNSLYLESCDNMAADYQKGLFIDIFPFIDYPSVSESCVKRFAKGISTAYSILHSPHYYTLRSFAEFFWFGARYAAYRMIWGMLCLLYPKKTYISNILINNGYGIMHRKDSVFPLGEITFEGKRFSAPCNPDAYLRDLYRNYMDMPPENKRKVHAVYLHPQLLKK